MKYNNYQLDSLPINQIPYDLDLMRKMIQTQQGSNNA
jgi:hypothetical protein